MIDRVNTTQKEAKDIGGEQITLVPQDEISAKLIKLHEKRSGAHVSYEKYKDKIVSGKDGEVQINLQKYRENLKSKIDAIPEAEKADSELKLIAAKKENIYMKIYLLF